MLSVSPDAARTLGHPTATSGVRIVGPNGARRDTLGGQRSGLRCPRACCSTSTTAFHGFQKDFHPDGKSSTLRRCQADSRRNVTSGVAVMTYLRPDKQSRLGAGTSSNRHYSEPHCETHLMSIDGSGFLHSSCEALHKSYLILPVITRRFGCCRFCHVCLR